jgi:hypothetical protein
MFPCERVILRISFDCVIGNRHVEVSRTSLIFSSWYEDINKKKTCAEFNYDFEANSI